MGSDRFPMKKPSGECTAALTGLYRKLTSELILSANPEKSQLRLVIGIVMVLMGIIILIPMI